MVCEVLLHRIEERCVGFSCELRPAFAVGDPPTSFARSGLRRNGGLCLERPAECRLEGLLHGGKNQQWPLSIRFQSVSVAESGGERTRIQLCGRLSIEIAGVHMEQRLRGRQVRLLLAYLVLNRARPLGRDELVDALWPRRAPVARDAALRTLLSRLRSGIGSDSLTGRDELSLTFPEPVWVDIEAAGAELARARQALARGDPRSAWGLAQVPLNIATRGLLTGHQAAWLEAPRRELDEVRLDALEVIGAAGLRMGPSQAGSVERSARALIDAEPYRESGYVLLMDALALRGNVAEGLRVFEGLRALLRDELGTSPSPEAIAAHQRLLHPRNAPVAPVVEGIDPEAAIALPAELRDRGQSPLVGRTAEVAELTRLWGDARDGVPAVAPGALGRGGRQIVVLSGDAGIGKTSLAAELARRSHEEGGVVLAGHSQEEGLAPYQPFLEALSHYFASAPAEALVPAVREYGPELARLIPELRRRLPELEHPEPGEAEIDRYRLFEAVVGLLRAIAERAPILLVLDDLHWADQPTLLLLRHLARAREPSRLLILVVYRSERTDLGVMDTLSDLRREGLLTSLEITGLSPQETAELIRRRTGETPSHALTRALQAEAEGNPFFVEEIVRNLVAAGVSVSKATASELSRFRLPEGVGQVVARRLSRLGPGTVEWLRVAAVIGRDFDVALLEQVVALPEEEFLAALEEALTAGLLLESDQVPAPARYSFSHALIRDAIYESMSAARRVRTHRRVGEALEASGHAPVRTLALHFTRAASTANAEKAVSYARAAGAEAASMLAHEEAAQHYARALEVLSEFRPESGDRLELLNSLGEELVRAGERPAAWEAFREAATLARRAGDSAALARAAIGASRRYVAQPGVVEDELVGMLERALEHNRDEVSLPRVQLLGCLAGALSYSPERARTADLAAEAERSAEALGDPFARAYALGVRRRSLLDPAAAAQRLSASTEMLTLARQAGDLELQLQAHAWLVVDLLTSGDRHAVAAQIEVFEEGAQQLRDPLYLWQAAVWAAMAALLDGRLTRAEELAREALAAGRPSESITAPQYCAFQMFMIRREQRRTAEVESTVAELAGQYPLRAWKAVLAVVHAEALDVEEGREELDRQMAGELAGVPRDSDWIISCALLAELAGELEDSRSARVLYELLAPYAGLNLVAGVGAACLGPISRVLGRLATGLGERQRAVEYLEPALEACGHLGSPLLTAHTQIDLAAALGPGLRASRLLDDASATAEQLGLARVGWRTDRLRRR